MSVPYRITVRVSKETMDQLEDLVESFQYENVSDIVRRAIDEFIERNYRKGPTTKIDLVLPKRMIQDLEKDLDQGTAISLDDLIRVILRDYTLNRMNKEIGEISKEGGIE
ncbi:MAG: ribbon-helix-helix domain-containing protein [Candidatus Thermoplasmatota archaeon]|nr:ribbon-helix-helix domain-containing protein [Candidatus Thermoplasmatota archaeon]MCL5990130.1 ribbon-helix-helix domain-containing protein [Candidatus Thermoplasmatota archaeon]MCW6168715.1 ribbon-helix-helix domain-containing protein [Thermoplasmatales archaeon]MCW6170024.1 ribbon-helix-helix domain-containing protein [Thermoplasmatales archaeon]